MKRALTIATMAMLTLVAVAKDIKTVVLTTLPQMHCENCERKIKGNLRFERGVKAIETDVEAQRVTVTYDADKTTPERLAQAFRKFGYEATIVTDDNESNDTQQAEE